MPTPAEIQQQQLANLATVCREVGLRLTQQRLEVFRALLLSTDHPTAETLHRRLREKIPTLSLDTVYRTLATLAQHRLINRVETIESLIRFEVILAPHHHLICSSCGEIVDFQWPQIDRLELPEPLGSWGRIERKHLVIYGQCHRCLAQPAARLP